MVGSIGNNYNNYYGSNVLGNGQNTNKTEDIEFSISGSNGKCPYSNLAKNGVIEYNGVIFNCDYKHNAITLGDVNTNPRKVLTVGLSGGGSLKVNVDNLDDLSKAVGMFSPADLNAIIKAIQTYKHCTSKLKEMEDEENEATEEAATSETNDSEVSAAEDFKNAVEEYREAHELTPDNIQVEEDWRKMSAEEWDKLVEHIDKFIDEHRQELEEMRKVQEEAARKMAAEAPANMKAIAAANAALKVATNGIVSESINNDETLRERESWTYNMQTDDQVILATAKMANEYASDMMTKSQELAITDTTTVGISSTSEVKECASVDENDKDKVWTITAFSQEGIICKRGKAGEEMEDLWSIKYENPDDYKKVWDFLDRFDKETDLKFAGDKDFWEDFLAGRIPSSELNALVERINAETHTYIQKKMAIMNPILL